MKTIIEKLALAVAVIGISSSAFAVDPAPMAWTGTSATIPPNSILTVTGAPFPQAGRLKAEFSVTYPANYAGLPVLFATNPQDPNCNGQNGDGFGFGSKRSTDPIQPTYNCSATTGSCNFYIFSSIPNNSCSFLIVNRSPTSAVTITHTPVFN